MKIGEHFKAAKAQGHAAFVPYITAGDPSLEATELFVRRLVEAGAAAIELGVPFSDPMADGPTNQRAAERALKSGTSLKKVIALVARVRASGITTPIVLFTYFNPVFKMGFEAFAESAAQAGVNGVLTVDLPPEEATEYRAALGARALETIFLASPTTPPARLSTIGRASSSVVYYVARNGVTGAQRELPEELLQELAQVTRGVGDRAVMVGFGISAPEQAKRVGQHADAVVVGSALVQLIENSRSASEAADRLTQFSLGIVAALKEGNEPC